MNSKAGHKSLTLLLAILFMVGVPAVAMAATAADTTISNQATVNYKVSSVDQTPVNSNTASFKVDRKVNLTVAEQDSTYVTVAPGATGQVLTFTVTNNGNDTFDYDLGILNGTDPFGGTDNFNPSSVSVFVEDGTNAGYQSGEDTAIFINDLAPGIANTVYVVSSIDLSQSTNDIAAVTLLATAKLANGTALSDSDDSGSADATDTVQNVYADVAGDSDNASDRKHSDTGAYRVAAAALSVSKSSTVISDPINSTTNPKAIPGAIVEYTITIENNDTATATNIAVSDNLTTEIDNGYITFETDSYAAGRGIQVTAPNLYGGSSTALTNADGDDEGDYNVTTTKTVTVTGIELANGETATVKFRVLIQ